MSTSSINKSRLNDLGLIDTSAFGYRVSYCGDVNHVNNHAHLLKKYFPDKSQPQSNTFQSVAQRRQVHASSQTGYAEECISRMHKQQKQVDVRRCQLSNSVTLEGL
jgi:hypothetical protein